LSAEPSTTTVAEALPAGRACVVMLGGRRFAVDVADAREVVMLDATTPVPGAPAVVVGVMNLRGNVLPVVEARPLLGLPVRAATDRALVLADGEQRAAVLVEAVLGLTTFDVASTEAGGGLTAGEVNADTGGRATLLDARAVLAALRRTWEPGSGGSR
jgi:purine-binding chemotaxis protein CheW